MSAIPQRSRTPSGAAYVERGSGEPLLLIHGVGMRLEAWAPQVETFGRSHRVIAVDMPGHGESAGIAPGSLLPDFVAWFGKVLDDLGLESVNVAGHSMGALIAGGMAASFGSRVKRVALLNGVYRRDPEARAAVLARVESIREGRIDRDGPLRRWFGENSEDSQAYHLTRGWLSKVDPEAYATAYAAFAQGDSTYADAWPDIASPALFLTGEDDPNSTPEMAKAMAVAAPAGQARIIAGHRHMVNLTAPETVDALLTEWLAREEVPA